MSEYKITPDMTEKLEASKRDKSRMSDRCFICGKRAKYYLIGDKGVASGCIGVSCLFKIRKKLHSRRYANRLGEGSRR